MLPPPEVIEAQRRRREEIITMKLSNPWPRAVPEEEHDTPWPTATEIERLKAQERRTESMLPSGSLLGGVMGAAVGSGSSKLAQMLRRKPEDHIQLMAERLSGCEKDKWGNPLPCHGCCHSREEFSHVNGEPLIDFPGTHSEEAICGMCVRSPVPCAGEQARDMYHTVASKSFLFNRCTEMIRAQVEQELREEAKLNKSKKTHKSYLGKTTLNKIVKKGEK